MDFPPEVERSHFEDLRKFGEALPERMLNKPNLHMGLALYFNAWFELDIERDRTEQVYIKRSDCMAYARDYEFSWEQYEALWFYMRHMDKAFFEWHKKKQPKAPTTPNPRATKRKGR